MCCQLYVWLHVWPPDMKGVKDGGGLCLEDSLTHFLFLQTHIVENSY